MQHVEKLNIRHGKGGTILSVKVVPGSSRDRIVGVLGDCLKVTTAAAPERGRANAAVAGILAETLGVDRRDVQLVAGQASPRKEFKVAGLSPDRIREILAAT